jgi:hypothetical protein
MWYSIHDRSIGEAEIVPVNIAVFPGVTRGKPLLTLTLPCLTELTFRL